MSLWDYDAITLAGMLRRAEVSAREVVAAHIERVEAVDGAVNALVTRSFETAMARAASADEAPAAPGSSQACCTGCRSRTRTSSTQPASGPPTGPRCSPRMCPTGRRWW